MCIETPELYSDELETLKQIIDYVDNITSNVPKLFSIEIRVKMDDVDSWAVVGWGEAGDPCVLRFECDGSCDPPLVPVTQFKFPYTINNAGSTS